MITFYPYNFLVIITFIFVKLAGPFTLFAPTDEAFRALPAGVLDSLIANPEKLKNVLLTHVVSGTIYSRGLPSGAVPVVAGGTVNAVSARGKFCIWTNWSIRCEILLLGNVFERWIYY